MALMVRQACPEVDNALTTNGRKVVGRTIALVAFLPLILIGIVPSYLYRG